MIEWRASKLLIEGNGVKAYDIKVSRMATQPSRLEILRSRFKGTTESWRLVFITIEITSPNHSYDEIVMLISDVHGKLCF